MKMGFFDLGIGHTLDTVRYKQTRKRIGCDACGLFRNCNSPKMKYIGNGKKEILIVGEAPGEEEDIKGVPFVGVSGRMLRETLSSLGIKMRQDCWISNAVACRPIKNVTPNNSHINECRDRLLTEINRLKPKVIILLGSVAVQSVLGHKMTGRLNGIRNTAFYSYQIPDQDYQCWICPTYHPAYILRNEKDKVLYNKFVEDLQKAIELSKQTTFPKIEPAKNCFCTTDLKEAISILQKIIDEEPPYIVFDYETTGIKPHREGHKIVSVSIATVKKSYSFPFFEDENFRSLWKEILISSKIVKIAHKIDFEDTWTYIRAGNYWVNNWIWDTCIASHCINNTKPTGLKFLTYVYFGILGYDIVEKFIKKVKIGEDEKSSNRFNCILEAPIRDILYYNALDSFFTMRLFELQKKLLHKFQLEGANLFLKGIQSFAKIQLNGMSIDIERANVQFDRLTVRMQKLNKAILNSDEVKLWNEKIKTTFNFNSNKQMSKMLYELLGYESVLNRRKTDIKALESIDSDFTKNILKYRKFKKLRDTYLSQYMREHVDGKIRPFFNLHLVDTFRSSSDSPNFQNIPKRDEFSCQIIRSIIKPRLGNKLNSYDYKSIEVCISACYHKDPTMINYIQDPSTDMHRDIAMELFFRDEKTFTKKERYLAKNGFVFPAFYGSTASISKDDKKRGIMIGEITKNLWEDMSNETKIHIEKEGIKNIKDFQNHVRSIERIFWDEKFPVYKDWKKKVWKDYEKKGYVELYTGFRCYGPLEFTKVSNYRIQGTAFHCVLWTLINIERKIFEISGKSSIIGQIHDDIDVDVFPDDEKEIDRIIKLYGTKKIREHWDWIIVPLKIEKESSLIDGDWGDMKECGIL